MRPRPTERLFHLLRRRRLTALLGLFVLVLVAAVGIGRLQIRTDVLALLVNDSDVGPEFTESREAARLVRTFGARDTLLIDVSLPGQDTAALIAAADAYAERLRQSGPFRGVVFRIDPAEGRKLARVLFDHRFELLPRPDDQALSLGLRAAVRDLQLPAAGAMEGLVFRDPLDHRTAIADRLRGAAPALLLDTGDSVLLSVDREHALLVAEPATPALQGDAAAAVLAAVHALAPPNAVVEPYGGHVFAVSAEETIRADVAFCMGLTLVAVIVLLVGVMRQLAAVLVALVPVLLGSAAGQGLLGWCGMELHGLSLGFGAVVLGVGIDYGTYLTVHYRARRGTRSDETPDESMAAVLDEVDGALWSGFLTTVAALLPLAFSESRPLRELLGVVGTGVSLSFLITLVFVPLALPRLWPNPPARRPRGPGLGPRLGRLAWPTVALVVFACVLGLPRLRVDGDVRNLDHQPPEIRALEARMQARYDPPRWGTWAVATGHDLEAALQANDRVHELLTTARTRGLIKDFNGLGAVLPSAARQAETRSGYRAEALRAALATHPEAADLQVDVFEPFFADLARPQAALSAVDLQGTPLAPAVGRMIHTAPGRVDVLTLVYPQRIEDRDLPAEVRDGLAALPFVHVVSTGGLAREAVARMQSEFLALAPLACLIVVGVLLFHYRNVRYTLLALVPVVAALAGSLGVMGWLDRPLNIVGVGVFVLLAGVAEDYGLFVLEALRNKNANGESRAASESVRLAAATTIAGFVALVFADSPVMNSLGFTISVGVLLSLVASTVLLPPLWRRFAPPDCPRCGHALRRPASTLSALASLAISVQAAMLCVAWLRGPRDAYGLQTVGVLGADAVFLALLWWRRRHRPLSCPKADCPAPDQP